MSKLTNILAAGLVALAPSLTFAAGEGWLDDYDVAVAQAKEQGKDLLVDFTGSDWCTWCIRLDEEVFAHAEFSDYAKEHYVLVALDFPNAEEIKAKVPNPERNQELSELYGVQGFPTILLVNVDGDVFGRTGYRQGGPGPYVEYMKTLAVDGKAALAAAKADVARLDEAVEGERMGVLASLIDAYEALDPASDMDAIRKPVLKGAVMRAIDLDPDNAAGMKLRAVKTLLVAGDAGADVVAIATELDPKNEHGLYELVVKGRLNAMRSIEDVADFVDAVHGLDELGIRDEAVAIDLYANCAWVCWQHLDRKQEAIDFANKGLALEPEDGSTVTMLKDLLARLAPEEEPAGEAPAE